MTLNNKYKIFYFNFKVFSYNVNFRKVAKTNTKSNFFHGNLVRKNIFFHARFVS